MAGAIKTGHHPTCPTDVGPPAACPRRHHHVSSAVHFTSCEGRLSTAPCSRPDNGWSPLPFITSWPIPLAHQDQLSQWLFCLSSLRTLPYLQSQVSCASGWPPSLSSRARMLSRLCLLSLTGSVEVSLCCLHSSLSELHGQSIT